MTDDMAPDLDRWADVDPSSLWDEALDALTDADEDRYWGPVQELHRRGTVEIFDEAMRRAGDDDDDQRVLACNVLGQLAFDRGHPFCADSVPMLIGLCADEMPRVAASAISALGHLGAVDAAPAVIAQAAHDDADVRWSVAFALPSLAGTQHLAESNPLVRALIALTKDEDPDVRDWATFGLGGLLMVDGPKTRKCLRARLDDPDADTRSEAINGLARRHDRQIVDRVRAELESDEVGRLVVQAAAYLADASLLEALESLDDWWDVDIELLERAIDRCDPAIQSAELALLAEFLFAAERSDAGVAIFSNRLTNAPEGPIIGPVDEISVDGGTVVGDGASLRYSLEALMARADGSVEGAVERILSDQRDERPAR
ncbi:MAG: HEAT repeat domain-containing protein [Acidimicrobiia bacterium]